MVLALALGLAVPSAASTATASAASTATNWAVGDSITDMSRDEILNRFYAAGWPGGVAATPGYLIQEMRPSIRYIAAGEPGLRRIFIYLGTNDASHYQNVPKIFKSAVLKAAVNQLHAAVHDVIDVRPKACVFLVTLHDFNIGTPDYHHAVMTLNGEMKNVIDPAFSKVSVIDWNAISSGKPWFTTDIFGIIGHLNQTGQNALADTYRWVGTTTRPCGP